MMNTIQLRPCYLASVSGGKDSLFMLYLILKNIDKYPLDGVMHYDIGNDFPFVKNVLEEMKKLCDNLNIPFYIVKPSRPFKDVLQEKGFPSKQVRWCNGLKIEAKRDLKKLMKMQGKYIVEYIGFCANEISRFKYQIGKIKEGQTVIYPIAEEGINENDILEWARTKDIFNDYYKVCDRQGCMLCPMCSYKEMAYTMIKYPNESSLYWSEVFKMWDKGINCLRGDKYDPEYIYNRVKTKYIPLVQTLLDS